MKFLSPLAFAFAATIPVVVVFYLLKRRRVTRVVSSTLLWQRFLAENQASAPFQKLRHNWLLLLQILLLALAVLALARPYFSGDLSAGRLQVVILDGSASMRARDGKPTRFESAKEEALKLVDGLRDRDQMVVVLAAGVTEVRQSPTSTKPMLRRAIRESQATDSPTRLIDALKLAETLTKDAVGAEVHLMSDGGTTDLAELEDKGMKVIYHRMGERGSNVGIVGIDVRGHPDDARQRLVFATIANTSSNAVSTTLELLLDGRVLEARNLSMEPRSTVSQIFNATQEQDGYFTIKLNHADDLDVDNEASVVSRLPQPMKVLLVTEGNGFLEKALRSVPGVALGVVRRIGAGKLSADVVVMDLPGTMPWPEANALAIRAAAPGWFTNAVETEASAVVDWRSAHPLLRSVGMETVQVAKTLAVQTPVWATSLVEAARTPLIFAGEYERRRVVWVGFDLYQSTWPLRISFPIFIANVMEWLGSGTREGGASTIHTGGSYRIPASESGGDVRVRMPGGEERLVRVESGEKEVLFVETTRAGVYRARVGTNDYVFAANLTDAQESDLWPREELKMGKHAGVTSTTVRRADLETWRWLAAAGLVVLLWEWWYYHRRTV